MNFLFSLSRSSSNAGNAPGRRKLLAAAFLCAVFSKKAGAIGPSEAGRPARRIRDSRGEHGFSATPSRVVALQWDLLENLIALGIRPVGAADTAPWRQWVRTPALPEGIADVGTRAEPNIECIASLKPDLILIGPTQLDRLQILGKIAPVLCFENAKKEAPLGQAEGTIANLLALGRLFEREARAQALVMRIDETLARLGEEIRHAFGGAPAVQVIRFSGPTTLFVYTSNSIAHYALEKMGLRQPLDLSAADYGLTQLRIRDLKNLEEAYVIYVRPFAMEKKVLNSILWRATPFARKGRVAAAEPYWSHGGALSILATAESICQALLTLAPDSGGIHRKETA